MLEGSVRVTTYVGRRVPPGWVWVNQLAHADFERLVGIANRVDLRWCSRWDDACAYLAAELLARGHGPRRVAALQRVLIRIELDLLDGAISPIETPGELVELIYPALANSRST